VYGAGSHGDNFPLGGKFSGMNCREEVLHWWELTEFLYEILVNCLTLSLTTQFCMWRCSGGIVRGLFSAYFDSRDNISTEGGIFK